MPTLNELSKSSRTERVQLTGATGESTQAVSTQQEKLLMKDLESLGQLTEGAAKTSGAVYEASVWADEKRADDANLNYTKGLQSIDDYYKAIVDSGRELTVKEIADKRKWQKNFYKDSIAGSISQTDKDSDIYKDRFLTPSAEMLKKVDDRDSSNMFVAFKKEWNSTLKEETDVLKQNYGLEAAFTKVKEATQMKMDNANGLVFGEIATSVIENLKGADDTLIDITNDETIAKSLDNFMGKYLKYDEEGSLVTTDDRIDDVASIRMKDAWLSKLSALKRQKKDKVIYDTSNYSIAKDKMNAVEEKFQLYSEDDIQNYYDTETELTKEGYFNSTSTISSRELDRKRRSVYQEGNKAVRSNLSEAGIILDVANYRNKMNTNTDADKSMYLGVVNNEVTKLSETMSKTSYNFDDKQELAKQRNLASRQFTGMNQNLKVASIKSPLYEEFEDIDKNGVKNTDSFSVDKMYSYAIYKEKMQSTTGVRDRVSKQLYQILESDKLSEMEKLQSTSSILKAEAMRKTSEKASPFMKDAVSTSIMEAQEGWFTWDTKTVEGTNSVFINIAGDKFTTAKEINDYIGSKDVMVVTNDMIPFTDQSYGLFAPDGLVDADIKMKGFVNAIVANENSIRASKIDKGDISFEPYRHNDDIGYYVIVKSGSETKKIPMNKTTLEYGWAIDDKSKNLLNAKSNRPVSKAEKLHAERQSKPLASFTDIMFGGE